MKQRTLVVANSVAATPPSYNTFRQKHWRVEQRSKKAWQEIFEIMVMEKNVPRDRYTFCKAWVNLRFPNKIKRDLGNFRVMVEKALPDALVNGRWIPDDDPEHFELVEFTFDSERGPRQTSVRLEFFQPHQTL